MKKIFAFLVVLLFAISLSACCCLVDIPANPQEEQLLPQEQIVIPQETEPPTEPATEPATEPPQTEPEHSEYYIPGVSVEDVIVYFNEVCLDAEFVSGGDPSRLQKWDIPIYYQLDGSYTQEDLAVLTEFTAWLNTIEGFPGIYESGDLTPPNLRIFFCTQQRMVELMGDNFYNMDGGVTFWYDYDRIYDATICYRTDLSQTVRNSVILEEIYNGLGPAQDTSLREDSIIFSGYSEPQALTAVDELLLKLLYHPEMQCGMDTAQCEAVIRQLYY